MKLNSISLSNFGLFEEGSMKFTEPVTYFTGANRRGKSTILKAIGWALTGVAPETGADGRNSESLVRIGQPPSGMCVVLDTDKGEVARRVGDTLKSKVGLDIAKRLGVPREVAMVCLAWNGFIGMDSASARSLLLGLLGVEVSTEMIKKAVGADFEHIPHVGFTGPESIATAYKMIYQERASARGTIKGIAPPDMTQFPDDFRAASAAEAVSYLAEDRATLAQLETELEHAIAASAQASGRQSQTAGEYEKRLKEAKARMDKVKLKIAGIGAVPDVGKLDKELKAANKAVEAHREAMGALNASMAVAQAEVKRLRAAQEAFAGNTGGRAAHVCPTCSTQLSKDVYDAVVKGVLETMMAEEAKLERLNETKVLLTKDAPESKAKRAADALQLGKDLVEKAKALSDDLHAIGEEIGEIEADKAAASDSAATEGLLPLAATDSSDEINVLRQRVSKGREIVSIWERYIPERKRADRYEQDLADAKAREAALDRLVKAFEPKGPIMTSLIEPKLAPFFKTINDALEPFGYGATINLDDGFELTIQDGDDGPWVPFRSISDSERVRLGFAIQVAFARSSGFGLVVTDEVDRLDADSRGAMVEAVDLALKDGVEQVILAGTMSEPEGQFEDPKIHGWQFLEVG